MSTETIRELVQAAREKVEAEARAKAEAAQKAAESDRKRAEDKGQYKGCYQPLKGICKFSGPVPKGLVGPVFWFFPFGPKIVVIETGL